MNPARDVVAHLAAAGLGLVEGSNLFVGEGLEVDGPAVFVIPSGGPPPSPYLGTGKSFAEALIRIQVKGTPDDPAGGMNLGISILQALHLAELPGYVATRAQMALPMYLGADDAGAGRWACNVECQWVMG